MFLIVAACATVEEDRDGPMNEPVTSYFALSNISPEPTGSPEPTTAPELPIESYPVDICDEGLLVIANEAGEETKPKCEVGETKIMVRHSPLYMPVPHQSVITATATNSTVGISEIRIYAVRGAITDCSELGVNSSVIPCREDASVLSYQDCIFVDSKGQVECELELSIGDGDIISYFAVATLATGTSQPTSAITYSGGRPAGIQVAMPVWVHTDIPNASLSAGQINLALYMDYGTSSSLNEFGSDVSVILENAFFNHAKNFSRNYTENRNFFDIWAFPFPGATAQMVSCKHDFAGNAGILDGLVNGSAVLHKNSETDCSTVATGGAGSIGVDKGKPDWLLVHESGHFLFGLADEYGDGGQKPQSNPHNVFAKEGDCGSAAGNVGASSANCVMFGNEHETYRVQTYEPETMSDEIYTSDFYNSAAAAIRNRISVCLSGTCYPFP